MARNAPGGVDRRKQVRTAVKAQAAAEAAEKRALLKRIDALERRMTDMEAWRQAMKKL